MTMEAYPFSLITDSGRTLLLPLSVLVLNKQLSAKLAALLVINRLHHKFRGSCSQCLKTHFRIIICGHHDDWDMATC